MRRSDVNRAIRSAAAAFSETCIHLPPFASWKPSDWVERRTSALELMRAGLGWDVVEWRPGEFAEHGLVLFTLRNVLRAGESAAGDGYAEKVMLVKSNQRTPLHAHRRKMEDIINRGGGTLVIEVRAEREEQVGRPVLVNGVAKVIAGERETVILTPGESITFPPDTFHAFYASGDDVIVGEVSTYNDDASDNDFLEPLERFPSFEEDAPAERLVVGDYPRLMSAWA